MSNTPEYAGSLFSTPREADKAAVYDWLMADQDKDVLPADPITELVYELISESPDEGFTLPSGLAIDYDDGFYVSDIIQEIYQEQ